MTIRKEVLKKIWEWLKTQITDEDLDWLKKHQPRWKEVSKDRSDFWQWEAEYTLDIFGLSFGIQEVLDAKKKRKVFQYNFGDGLPKQYVVELAELLNLGRLEDRPKYWILSRILGKIEDENPFYHITKSDKDI